MSSLTSRQERWVHTWASVPMLADGDNLPPQEFVSRAALFDKFVSLYRLNFERLSKYSTKTHNETFIVDTR
jgi:hypothetical protein